MNLITCYNSPLGKILLAGDENALTGLWFEEQKHYAAGLSTTAKEQETPIFKETKRWLDLYFAGRDPQFLPPLCPQGTPFQQAVWTLLQAIPFCETRSYGDLAQTLCRSSGSARAVGQAVGRNPISILIPCHRVLGGDGRLTGYAGGSERKKALLRLEEENNKNHNSRRS